MSEPLQPLEPIEVHYYYACSWVISDYGIDHFHELATLAEHLKVGLRVRRMFTDPSGYVIYPFTVKVPDEAVLRAFVAQAAAEVGMIDWYIVNVSYYEQGVPFADNLRLVAQQIPLWEQHIRQYAAHNATLAARRAESPSENDDSEPDAV